jgi:tetratricopeptide (TPR) repeat protein
VVERSTPSPDGTARVVIDDLTWSEVADAVWLAAATQRAWSHTATTPVPSPAAQPARKTAENAPKPESPQRNWRDGRLTTRTAGTGQQEQFLHLVPTDPGRGGQPIAALLSSSSNIIRALRPLKRKVLSWREDEVILDEDATAEQSVRNRMWWPITKPRTARWLDLTLVVDSGPSMGLWQSTVTEFISLLQQLGAFRTIQLRLLDTHHARGAPILRGGMPGTPTRGPAELLDPFGRRIMLVLTDCVSEAWRSGQVSPMLARWGAAMPVAVVHLLPQRLWARDGLALHRARVTVRGPLRPNWRWGLQLPDGWLDPELPELGPGEAVPIPFLELDPRWLGWWARVVTGARDGPADAMVLLTGNKVRDLYPVSPGAGRVSAPSEAPAELRVRNFLSVASPQALRLATLLAAVPVSLPVARFVQSEFVPGSGPDHLAEVFTSGLLQPPDGAHGERAWDTIFFDFPESVRQVLLGGARRSETVSVVRRVVERFGSRTSVLGWFRDALAGPDDTPDPAVTTENAYYVSIERTVMRALSGPYLSRAERLANSLGPERPLAGLSSVSTTGTAKNPVSDNMPDVAKQADFPNQRGETSASATTVPEAPIPRPAPPGDSSADDLGATVHLDAPSNLGTIARQGSQDDQVPLVWGNVPPRNPNFTGRIDLLDQLSKRLAAGGTTAILPAALHGMGGIGKTQIAVEYIYRHLADYEVVWWIQAAQPAQVRAALNELAKQLRLPGVSESAAAVPAVLEALRLGQPHRRWLLVFDAAESPDMIRHFFPTNGPGKILITSRNPEWASVARPLEVAVFHRDESVELLKRRGPEMDDQDADHLATKLGDLPLAIEQAAAWRAETGMPVREYLRLFDEKVAEILDTSAPTNYEVSVAAAWNVSFDELKTRSPAAHQLLQVCAFFAPEPITRNLFAGTRGVSISPELDGALRDPMQLSRAIRDIARYGLAKIDHRNNTLQLHRLVQLVLRNRMTPEQREEKQHGAHILLANYDPNDPKSAVQWPRYQEILPHVAACELTDCQDPWGRQLVLNLMQYLYFWGDYEEAAALGKDAIARWTELSEAGESDPQVLEAASNRGLYLWVRGRFAEAAEINERTLALRRQVSDDTSEETIIARLRVAVDTRSRGDFYGARDMNEEIYETALRTYGEDDPITLQTAHDLAVSVRLCGDYRRAFDLNQSTSQRRAEVLGYDNVDTLNTLSGLFMDRRELGDYPLARSEHERIAQRVQGLIGEDKNDTLRRFAYLAVARRKDGDHAGALELSTRAYELFRRQYTEDHHFFMACAIDHSNDLRHADDFDGALALGRSTFERYRTNLGERHPHTLAAAVDLAVTLRLSGDAAAARQLNEHSLELFNEVLTPEHPYSIMCAINLASDIATVGDAEAARSLGSTALERSRRVLGPDHPTTIAAGLNAAFDLRSLGHNQEAEIQYADVIARFRRVLGETHSTTVAAIRGKRANCDIDPLPL